MVPKDAKPMSFLIHPFADVSDPSPLPITLSIRMEAKTSEEFLAFLPGVFSWLVILITAWQIALFAKVEQGKLRFQLLVVWLLDFKIVSCLIKLNPALQDELVNVPSLVTE